LEEETIVALTIPALIADRIAARGSETVLRRKYRGIWQAVSWSQLGTHVRGVTAGLAAIGFQPGEVACVLAETRPESVYADLGILSAGGVSGAIHPAIEPEALADVVRQARCRVLFAENEEQLDKALAIRDSCPTLQRIVVFDMKGLRDFADPMCESLQNFSSRTGNAATVAVGLDHPAVLLPQGQVLTHGDALHLVEHARSLLQPRKGDERVALLPMSDAVERVLGLYLSLDVGAISNYLESPETVVENLQEVQPTLLGTDPRIWQLLYDRVCDAAENATSLQRSLYRWATASSGGPLARLLVLNAVRREIGLGRLHRAYIGTGSLPAEIMRWTTVLGIELKQIDGQTSSGAAAGARYRAHMQEAYG
jgi:long-chain acyl-CoA synthetase